MIKTLILELYNKILKKLKELWEKKLNSSPISYQTSIWKV